MLQQQLHQTRPLVGPQHLTDVPVQGRPLLCPSAGSTVYFLARFSFAWHLIKVMSSLTPTRQSRQQGQRSQASNACNMYNGAVRLYPKGGAQQSACAQGQAEH